MTNPPEGPGAADALPPELSPRGSAARPATRRRSGGVLRKVVAVAAAFVVLGSATGYAMTNYYGGQINQIDVFGGIIDRPEKGPAPAKNILVAGSDDRTGLTAADKRRLTTGFDEYGKRSDTMILMHISDERETITAISFPRDSLVTIPSYVDGAGNRQPESRNKLNAAYAFGGEKLMIRTIEKATGVRIDHYLEVNIAGFVRMVDAVGKVEVCVPEAVSDEKSGLVLPAGKSKLNGDEALAFVRARNIYPDADLGRIRAQQRFIGSMISKATSSEVLLNPLKLNNTLNAVFKSVTTDMNNDQLIELAQQVRTYEPSKIEFLTVPIANGNGFDPVAGSVVVWDDAEAEDLFTKIKFDRPLEEPASEKLTVPPGGITVQVLNGAGIQGLGSRAADDLAGIGFAMADIAKNADVTDQTVTVVRYGPKKEAAAKTLMAAIPNSTGEVVTGQGKVLEVVVGSDYTEAVEVTVAGDGTKKPKARTAADDICA